MNRLNRLPASLAAPLLAGLLAAATLTAVAGEPAGRCRECGPCGGLGGVSTPYGDTGCGPRYSGAIHDDPYGVDPCDSCNRWRGCNGAREQRELLAPWQLPPGRGFQNAAQAGYAGNGGGGTCVECRQPWYRLW